MVRWLLTEPAAKQWLPPWDTDVPDVVALRDMVVGQTHTGRPAQPVPRDQRRLRPVVGRAHDLAAASACWPILTSRAAAAPIVAQPLEFSPCIVLFSRPAAHPMSPFRAMPPVVCGSPSARRRPDDRLNPGPITRTADPNLATSTEEHHDARDPPSL